MSQRIRISDIAEELGLSTATVSNVIHGKTRKISDETVKRVQTALEQHQYIPSMAGILLAQNSSKIIGVFVNDHEKYEGHTLEDAFIASSLNHLSIQIEAHGLFMMVKQAKRAEDILKFASMWNMDGLIVIGFCYEDYMYLRNHMHIPFVIYDGFCENPERIINTTLDNFDGGRQMGEHFEQLGHKKALCITDNETGVDLQRIQGFQTGFHGNVQTMVIPMYKEERRNFYLENLSIFHSVTSVFAVSDYYAIDLIQFLQEQGISVPEDLSVSGFDDIPLCQMICPTLTTVKQDSVLRAKTAVEGLLALKSGMDVETTIKLPVSLVIRNSTHSI